MINRLLLDKNVYKLASDFYNKKIRKMFTAIKSEATGSKETEADISSKETENLKWFFWYNDFKNRKLKTWDT